MGVKVVVIECILSNEDCRLGKSETPKGTINRVISGSTWNYDFDNEKNVSSSKMPFKTVFLFYKGGVVEAALV